MRTPIGPSHVSNTNSQLLSRFSFAAAGEIRYTRLGDTGLIVSSVALGTMQFGGKMNMGNLGQENTTRMVKVALDKGVNFIDTACTAQGKARHWRVISQTRSIQVKAKVRKTHGRSGSRSYTGLRPSTILEFLSAPACRDSGTLAGGSDGRRSRKRAGEFGA
jgi:hypothetical protein